MPLGANSSSSKDRSACRYRELERRAKDVDKAHLEVILQQWQLVQHCFSDNSDKVVELDTKVQSLSSSLEVQRTFSAGLNQGLKELFETVRRHLDAVDQNMKEQLVVERKARERQLQAFETRMVSVFEEGLFREKRDREDLNAELRKVVEEERAILRKTQRELRCEKEAREQLRDSIEQLRDSIEQRMESISCSSSAWSSNYDDSARDFMHFGTAPKLRSKVSADATFATAVANAPMAPIDSRTAGIKAAATNQTGPPPPSCTLPFVETPSFGGDKEQKQAAGDHLTANSEKHASLTGTWRLTSNKGWTRFSLPAMQFETQQQQQYQVQQQVQQSQQPQQSQHKCSCLPLLALTLQNQMQHSALPVGSLELPEREQTYDGVLPVRETRRRKKLGPGGRSRSSKQL